MKISVIGLGYVGQTVVAAAASSGFEVHGYDLNPKMIDDFTKRLTSDGRLPDGFLLYEVRENMQNVTLASQYDDFVHSADVKFLCVDTLNVIAASQMLGSYLKKNDIVIVESTISPETCDIVRDALFSHSNLTDAKDFFLAFVPERVMEGKLLQNFQLMPRAIGVYNAKSFRRATEVYTNLGVVGNLKRTDPQHATASKLFENAFRFLEISIANEFADICRENGLDYNVVRDLVNIKGHDMGYNELLYSGIGIGGSCLPMSARMAHDFAPDQSILLHEAIELNMGRPLSIATVLLAILEEKFKDLKGKKIAIFGATYRPDGFDVRDSPAVEIITYLNGYLEPIYIYDPLYSNGGVVENKVPCEIDEEFDAAIVLVGHHEFMDMSTINCSFFIDVTGVVERFPKNARRIGFKV